MRLVGITIACIAILGSTSADASRRKKKPLSRPEPKAQQMPQDAFRACDLQLRDQIRDGGTWLTPTELKIDDARLTLAVTHAFGQSGRSVPRSIRGDSDDERRQQLRAHLAELRGAVEAGQSGNAWLVIAPKTMLPPAARSIAAENISPWYALLLAGTVDAGRSRSFRTCPWRTCRLRTEARWRKVTRFDEGPSV
jgi:hypothetical protein